MNIKVASINTQGQTCVFYNANEYAHQDAWTSSSPYVHFLVSPVHREKPSKIRLKNSGMSQETSKERMKHIFIVLYRRFHFKSGNP